MDGDDGDKAPSNALEGPRRRARSRVRDRTTGGCSIPYARKLQKSSDLSDDERKVFAELSSVMKRYDTQYQSDLSKDAVQQWQKKTEAGKKKKK